MRILLVEDEKTLSGYIAKGLQNSGYAVDAEEYCIGLYCIAMPIRDYTGQIVAAVSVSTPSGLMDEDRKKLILEALSKCSRDISRSLGYQEK